MLSVLKEPKSLGGKYTRKWLITVHCDDAVIQFGTKSCGDYEKGYLNSLGYWLNEEEKLDDSKVHFHLEGTKY